jgi:uncharacterized protein YndB with AHSA1/START domain
MMGVRIGLIMTTATPHRKDGRLTSRRLASTVPETRRTSMTTSNEGSRTVPPVLERELVLTHTFDAPRELVFRMWTDPELLKRWVGPRHFTNPVCEVDLRPGGIGRLVMRSPEGFEFEMKSVYHEIARPERLLCTTVMHDQKGRRLLQDVNTVTFAEVGGQTKLTLNTRSAALIEAGIPIVQGLDAGWADSFARLAERLKEAQTE